MHHRRIAAALAIVIWVTAVAPCLGQSPENAATDVDAGDDATGDAVDVQARVVDLVERYSDARLGDAMARFAGETTPDFTGTLPMPPHRSMWSTMVTRVDGLTVEGDTATAHGLADQTEVDASGTPLHRFSAEWTVTLRRVNGKWLLRRAHFSGDPVNNPAARATLASLVIATTALAATGGAIIGAVFAIVVRILLVRRLRGTRYAIKP